MTPADLQIPERESAPVVEDPAVAAGKEAAEAAAAFNAMTGDETGPEYDAAQERTAKADDIFADAPVTSAAGALAKMEELRATVMSPTIDPDETYLDARHFKTVVAFLEGRTGAPAVIVDDPAVVALAEYTEAKAADDAISDEDAAAVTPEAKATSDRYYAAMDVVFAAVPTSMAGMAAKIRFIFDYQERGNDLWPAFDEMAKSMLPFLEGAAAVVPDPVVALFAEWGAINEEVIAHLAAIPKGAGENMGKTGHVPGKPGVAPEEKDWDDALDRREAVEKKILETPATSMRGVAVKIRLVTHCTDMTDLTKLYATPAREIDYEKECLVLDCEAVAAISALLDAEQLAGVS